MNTRDLRSAVAALNNSGIREGKIKYIAVKKEDLIQLFLSAIEDVLDKNPDQDFPDEVVDAYEELMTEVNNNETKVDESEVEENKVEKPEEETPDVEPELPKPTISDTNNTLRKLQEAQDSGELDNELDNEPGDEPDDEPDSDVEQEPIEAPNGVQLKSKMNIMIYNLISEAKYTLDDIVKAVKIRFPDYSKEGIETRISCASSTKWNKFPKTAYINGEGIMSYED